MRTESIRFGANTETSNGPYRGIAYRLRQSWRYAWGCALAEGIVATAKNAVYPFVEVLSGCRHRERRRAESVSGASRAIDPDRDNLYDMGY